MEWPQAENLSDTIVLRRADLDEEVEGDEEEREIETQVETKIVAVDPKKGLHRPDYDLWRKEKKGGVAVTAGHRGKEQRD